jgi:actin-related protein
MTKKLLKFGTLPGHWGLAGKTREIAKAEYELEGYELEKKLLEIRSDEYHPDDVKSKTLDIELKYHKISKSEYDRSIIELLKDETQRKLATLEMDYAEGKIKDMSYEKEKATLNKKSWVHVVSMDVNTKAVKEGSFELDWNDYFVKELEEAGYEGITPDVIVNTWFMEVCRNVAMEEFDGTGDFTADSEANLATEKRWGAETKLENGRKGYQ